MKLIFLLEMCSQFIRSEIKQRFLYTVDVNVNFMVKHDWRLDCCAEWRVFCRNGNEKE